MIPGALLDCLYGRILTSCLYRNFKMAYYPLRRVFVGAIWLLARPEHAAAQACWRDLPCSDIQEAAFPGEWDDYILAPESRTVSPTTVFDLATGEEIGLWPTSLALSSSQPGAYLDFSKEVGGIVTVDYEVSSVAGQGSLGLAFTEAKDWVGPVSDFSSGNNSRTDGAIYCEFSAVGEYTYVMPDEYLRGGFRYMTLFLLGNNTAATINNISLEISFQPTWSNLRAYQGYFHSNDDLLNKLWYSGAYTLQTDTVYPSTGRAWPAPPVAWSNTGLLGPGNTINTDGAKRDRTVWPGDMGVALPSSFYSTGDLESVKNGLEILYTLQTSIGLFPFSGPPLNASDSDTYHMWIMIGTYNYVLYSGDVDFLRENWAGYVKAMSFLDTQFDTSLDLINIEEYPNDWGRFNANGTLAEAQMLAYRTLVTGACLASWVGDDTGLNATWLNTASGLLDSINAKLWDEEYGAFKDNYGQWDLGLHPQDGNSLAVLFGIVNASSAMAQDISSWLTHNWTPIGPESPELTGEVSPFISSFEVQAHLVAGQTQRALDLIRTSWGWYLNNDNGTQSTMIEGYLVNGTFGYRWDAGYANDFSMTSHSHGWSTGPTSALTQYILGLSVTGLAGSTWQLAPQVGDLTSVEGGFTSALGQFSAGWTLHGNGTFVLVYSVPPGTAGEILLPELGRNGTSQVMLDGQVAKKSLMTVVQGSGGRLLYAIQGTGGQHRIVTS
ncbi:alpha-L-rhamnosidase B [Xylariaceae sp. FL0804]|nr:alpha-L-rhamnosidase B [Xylariaceae sp. FL0804]